MARAAATAGATFEQALFPSRCRVCRAWLEIPGETAVCDACLSSLKPETAPYCLCCGVFFDGAGESHYCGACLDAPPPFSRHRSFGRYWGVLKDVILLYKFRGFSLLGRILAETTHAALEGEVALWGGEPMLVPVPLHPRRERSRGFNQSLLLARGLAGPSGLEVGSRVLIRTRDGPPQSRLRAGDRTRNVRGVFAVGRGAPIRGRAVIVVDDVYTTGSTLKECASVLLRAGAAEVRGITLARA
ncbi:MAG: ComF family protein [Candidatus Aminicenantes bacterium]|nr:ComF family protein [Candidatus Aminicenantes bacterium]